MKGIVLSSLLVFMTINLFAQSDTIGKNKMNIGIGISGFISGATNFVVTSPSLNASLTAIYNNHSTSLGIVIGQKRKLFKGPQSWSPNGAMEVGGFSFHYRFVPKYQKKFSPVVGYNLNYIKYMYRNENINESSFLTNYESLVTLGIRWSCCKNINIIPEIALGYRYFEDIFNNSNYTEPYQKVQKNVLSGALKLSINAFS